ncbi:hypothetical protein BP5796_00513 [Coleophoma crateriformis]|uniref:DUF4211 domain-containing protein n=1 Tax=Coleophoma crateriformis TaxID=565419 RepID=A0A3D8T877_9HELO|nr:hypothetical protein BP5796_00513 [Coleophoma crateriformis]
MPPKRVERPARRKKQTRLVFDPVDSTAAAPTSAAANNSAYSPAKVRYSLHGPSQQEPSLRSGGSPSKMAPLRSLGKAKGKGNRTAQEKLSWPTPVKSSQDVGSAPIMSFGSNTARDTDSDGSDSDIVPPSSRRTRHSSPPQSSLRRQPNETANMARRIPTRFTESKISNTVSDSSDGSAIEEELVEASPKKSLKGKQKQPLRSISISSDQQETDETEGDDEAQLPVRRSTRSFIQGGSSYAAPISTPGASYKIAKSSSISKSRRQKSVTLSSDDDADELAASCPQKATRMSANQRGKQVAEDVQSSDDEDEDDVVITSSVRRRAPQLLAHDEEDDSEDIVSPLKRRRQPSTEEESDLDIERASPTKRQRGNIPDTPSRATRQAKPRRRTEKEKTMELLRRKRAGEKIDQLTESDSEPEGQGGIYDTDSSLQALSEFEDEPDAEAPTTRRGNKQSKSGAVGEDEDSWIVGDDEDNIGVPLGLNDIPLEFTHHAHKPLKEHFRDAVEWMIHNKINPAFARDDAVYKIAFQKLDDEVRGYANSKFVSSAWTESFNKAIWARPIFMEREIDSAGVEAKCGACNRSNHPPKFAVQFQGKAYSRATLEELDQGSDSSSGTDSNSDSDSTPSKCSVNSKGQSIPSEDTEWFVGRFCMANARTAHSLIHWRYALNEWVLGNLEGEGHLTLSALAARDKMKSKQRKKLANQITDSWTAAGTVKSLYGDFKRNLEAARNGKQERWGK